jgi:hypothetical protein
MDPIEEERRKAEEDVMKAKGEQHSSAGNGGDDSPITKGELRNEMKSMIQGLLEMDLIGPREVRELKLKLIPNDVKLEGSKNYLSWSRRVQVKGIEHYLREDCVEPANKLSPEWRVWHTTNSTIVAWLLASMSPSVSKVVEAMHTAAQI